MPKHAPLIKLLAVLIGLCFVPSVGDAATTTPPAGTSFVALTQRPLTLRTDEVVSGTLAATQPIHVEVALKLRNPTQLHSFIVQAKNPALPLAQRRMTHAQFVASYAPTMDQASKVAAYLKSAGFSNVTIAPNRLLVSADGHAGAARTAFKTGFVSVRTKEGRMAFMNNASVQIPAALQDSVLSVIGLQNVHQAHTLTVRAQAGAGTLAVTGHNPTEFSAIYGGSGLPTAAGVAVGIVTQGNLSQTIADLNTFTAQNGLATVTTQTVNTNGTSSDSSGVDEWNLDSQDIVGMAGGQVGKLIFYNIPTLSNANLTADFNAIVAANATRIINVSLGECETYAQQDGSAVADEQIFQQAIAQGQTFSVSSGDSASKFEPKPTWQAGVLAGNFRGVPDLAFDGDPNSGARIIVNGASTQVGGTSLSSPLFVGAWARLLAAHPTLGFAAPYLYQTLTAADYHDVTSGSNGSETATVGWDLASFFCSFNLDQVAAHIGGGGSPPPPNVPPVANFTDTVSGLTVNFTDSSSDSDGTIAARAWNFGDGGSSSATNPSHTYAAAGTYNVALTVTDNDGATNTRTQPVTVSSGGGTVLQNGVVLSGQSAAQGAQLHYSTVVPAGASNLVIAVFGGSGDADLYTKFGSAPTLASYDCRPYLDGNDESCTVAAPQAGTWYVMLNGYAAFSGASIEASWSTGGGGSGNVLQNGVPVTGLSAATGKSLNYTMVVPAGATNLKFTIAGGSGDADLYVRFGSAPTTRRYDCRPYLDGNNETCTFATAQAGTYYVRVRAFETFSGVSLTGSYSP